MLILSSIIKSSIFLPLLLSTTQLLTTNAFVFDNDQRWDANPNHGGFVKIPVCIRNESSNRSTIKGAMMEDLPSMDTLVSNIRSALQETYEVHSRIRFIDWRFCSELSSKEQDEALGLYVHSNAKSNVNVSNVGSIKTGKGNAKELNPNDGVKLKPYCDGERSLEMYWWSVLIVRDDWPIHKKVKSIDLECLREKTVYEFGRAIGIMHEWQHPHTYSLCAAEVAQSYHNEEIPVPPNKSSTKFSQNGGTYTVSDIFDFRSMFSTNNYRNCHIKPQKSGIENNVSRGLSPLDIEGIKEVYGVPLKDLQRIAVGHAYKPYRIMINSDLYPQEVWDNGQSMDVSGWTHKQDFWVFKEKQPGTIRIAIGQAYRPHRIMINHESQPNQDAWDAGLPMDVDEWTHKQEFWAFEKKQPGTIRIVVGQTYNPHRIVINHDYYSQEQYDDGQLMDAVGWDYKQDFWVYALCDDCDDVDDIHNDDVNGNGDGDNGDVAAQVDGNKRRIINMKKFNFNFNIYKSRDDKAQPGRE